MWWGGPLLFSNSFNFRLQSTRANGHWHTAGPLSFLELDQPHHAADYLQIGLYSTIDGTLLSHLPLSALEW
jgi:hypothetical protein